MNSLCSITSSCFTAKDVHETEFSKIARGAAVIVGIVAIVITGFIAHEGQLTIGMGILSGGISLTFIAALIKCVKNTQKPTKLVVHALSEIFPEPIVRNVLRFVKPRELAYCAQVSQKWKALIDENTWKQAWQNDPNIVYDFQPLVDKGLLTWSKVGSYVHFSSFLRRIDASLGYKVKVDCFASSGAYNFWVENSQIIYRQEKGSASRFILFDAGGRHIKYLATDRHFLFVLGRTGIVLQLDYLTGKIVQSIRTSYEKNEGDIWHDIKKEGNGPCESKSFHVEDGYIVLKYGNPSCPFFEVISYQSSNDRTLVKDLNIGCRKIFLCEEKVYILGRNHIYIWDIEKKQKHAYFRIEKDNGHFLRDAVLHNKFLYTSSTSKCGTVYATNLSTGATKMILNANSYQVITISNKFLYGYDKGIYIFDLDDRRFCLKSYFFNTDTHVNPSILETLITHEKK